MGSRALQVLLALAISAFGKPAGAADVCHFGDTAELQRTIVEPAERQALGSALAQWDTDKALVSLDGQTIRVVLMPRAGNLLDPPYFVILVEACGKGRIRSGLQAWDVAVGVRKPLPGEQNQPGYLHYEARSAGMADSRFPPLAAVRNVSLGWR
jgi:hypothetical protein